jgi:hypothetical protein
VNRKERNSSSEETDMRSKPKGSAPKDSAPKGSAREMSRAARSGRRAGSPATRRPPAPRADAKPIDRNSGALRHIGGSHSDEWNDRVAAETVQAIPLLECETRDQKCDAVLHGLIGIAPQDELEGMMAAQLIAAHAAAMDCYRCAAKEERDGERHHHLNQATRLSRAFATLLNALHRHRRTGGREQKSAKQPPTGTAAPPLAPAGASAARAEAETAHTESAKQPHAREIPPERATRLDGLRRNEERPDRDLRQQKSPNWGSLSDDELAAMTRTGTEEQRARASIMLVDRMETRRERAAAAATNAMPVRAQTKLAEQPSAPPPAPAPAPESARQPSEHPMMVGYVPPPRTAHQVRTELRFARAHYPLNVPVLEAELAKLEEQEKLAEAERRAQNWRNNPMQFTG